jgi:EpsD family peptidyl-prolyl cis-trans isomerase
VRPWAWPPVRQWACSPAAAKVNGSEISEAQISLTVKRAGNVPEDQVKKAGPQALESLIDQHLLVQKALEGKLDKDPQTALALENTRKQVLSVNFILAKKNELMAAISGVLTLGQGAR